MSLVEPLGCERSSDSYPPPYVSYQSNVPLIGVALSVMATMRE